MDEEESWALADRGRHERSYARSARGARDDADEVETHSAEAMSEVWRRGLLEEMRRNRSGTDLRRALLTRANVDGVTATVRRHLAHSHGWSPAEAAEMTPGVDDPFTVAFWDGVVVQGTRALTRANLHAANRSIVLRAVQDLDTDRNQRRRVDHFMRFGGSEAYADRVDRDEIVTRGDRREAKKAFAYGHGVHRVNPMETAFGGAIEDFDDIWRLVSRDKGTVAGTSDYDVRVLDHATSVTYGSHFP